MKPYKDVFMNILSPVLIIIISLSAFSQSAFATCAQEKAVVDGMIANQSLPSNYADMNRLLNGVRRKIFISLSSEKKVEFLKAHLDTYLPRLSADQKTYLTELENKFLVPANYSLPVGVRPADETVKAKQVFGEELALEMFNSLGDSTTDGKYGGTPGPVGGSSESTFSCGCATSSDFCDKHWNCVPQPSSFCQTTTSGCGFLWMYSCNGGCVADKY